MSARPPYVVLVPFDADSDTPARAIVVFAVFLGCAVLAMVAVVVVFLGSDYRTSVIAPPVTTSSSPLPTPPPCYPFADCDSDRTAAHPLR